MWQPILDWKGDCKCFPIEVADIKHATGCLATQLKMSKLPQKCPIVKLWVKIRNFLFNLPTLWGAIQVALEFLALLVCKRGNQGIAFRDTYPM
jgi:hypothetical protein